MIRSIFLVLFLFFLSNTAGSSQGAPDYLGGMKVTLNPDGSKYFRIVAWGQIWAQYKEQQNPIESNYSLSIRRARILLYYQLNKRFLLLSHFGVNGLNTSNSSPLGRGNGSQLFLHGLWTEYMIIPNFLYAGAGLHYWNGLSRLNSQSTLNMMTLDNNRSAWASLGLSDQFGRHLGIYLKGSTGRFAFRFAVNDAMRPSLDSELPLSVSTATYRGRELLGKDAQFTYGGYFEYFFGHRESSFLPYKIGSYLGSQRVLTVGLGFFAHPNGTVTGDGEITNGHDIFHYNIDLFLDRPLRFEKQDAITWYASYTKYNYGPSYLINQTSRDIGTGDVFYTHVGYVVPSFTTRGRLQPYVSYAWKNFDAYDEVIHNVGIGLNWYIHGHHAKITTEYKWETGIPIPSNERFTIQAMVYL